MGKRTKSSGLALLDKISEDLKKAIFYTDKFNVYYEISHAHNIDLLEKNLAKQVTLKDLIVLLDKDLQDL